MSLNDKGYCPVPTCGRWIVMRDRSPSGQSVCAQGHYTPTVDVHAEPLVQRAIAAAAEAARQALRDEGAVSERAEVVRMLYEYRDHAAAHGRPGEAAVLAMVSEVIAAGAHVRPVESA
jgi:hypothetical protein